MDIYKFRWNQFWFCPQNAWISRKGSFYWVAIQQLTCRTNALVVVVVVVVVVAAVLDVVIVWLLHLCGNTAAGLTVLAHTGRGQQSICMLNTSHSLCFSPFISAVDIVLFDKYLCHLSPDLNQGELLQDLGRE